jgi:hypothetical protein
LRELAVSVWGINPENMALIDLIHMAHAYKRRVRFEAQITAVAQYELFNRPTHDTMATADLIEQLGERV